MAVLYLIHKQKRKNLELKERTWIMTTFRKRHDIVAYHRTVLDDDRISLGAKGLFACLVSNGTETVDLEMHDMLAMTSSTTNETHAALRELVTYGYLKKSGDCFELTDDPGTDDLTLKPMNGPKQNAFSVYEKYALPTGMQQTLLVEYISKLSDEVVCYAIEQTVKATNGKLPFNYLKKILDKFEDQGITSIATAKSLKKQIRTDEDAVFQSGRFVNKERDKYGRVKSFRRGGEKHD